MITRITLALAILALAIGPAEAKEKKKAKKETATVQENSPLNPVYVSGGEVTNNGFNVIGKPQVTIGPDGKALITQGRVSAKYLGAVTENHVAISTATACADARVAIAHATAFAVQGEMEAELPDGSTITIHKSPGGNPNKRIRVNADCSIEYDEGWAAVEANRSQQLTNATWGPYAGFPPGLGGNAGEALYRLGQIDAAYGSQDVPVPGTSTTTPPKRSAGDKLFDEMDSE